MCVCVMLYLVYGEHFVGGQPPLGGKGSSQVRCHCGPDEWRRAFRLGDEKWYENPSGLRPLDGLRLWGKGLVHKQARPRAYKYKS